MEKALQVINELEREGIITRYAIGGAVGAIFYVEPVLTYDVDVFISLPGVTGAVLLLTSVYEWLARKGYAPQQEHVMIEGVPVQFLPPYNLLIQEALDEAREVVYGNTPTRVFRAEHLLAIMLQTYRPKDKARMLQMIQEAEIDQDGFDEIARRHGLTERWREFTA